MGEPFETSGLGIERRGTGRKYVGDPAKGNWLGITDNLGNINLPIAGVAGRLMARRSSL